MQKALPTVLITCFCLLAMNLALIADIVDIPPLKSRVTDLTSTLSVADIQHIEGRLAAFEQSKGSQIAVLIVPTTGDETIEQYGIRVADQWKLGREGVDDGIILLVAKNDRKVRIEVGYGLEGAVPDALAKRIIEQIILPEFRSGHFIEGVEEGTDAIIKLVQGEELPLPAARSPVKRTGKHSLWLVVIIGFLAVSLMRSFVKGTKGKVIAFIVIFLLGWWLTSLIVGLIIAALLSVFSSTSGSGRYYGGGGFYGGGGGFGGSSGGGFGGFSGGGGGFGGGGASGSW